tara:strand:+ start:3443 stop:3907 length:465 start_codon:yes stop_codon:yes gene_type:complete
MSFSIVLNTASASQYYAVNTAGKDFTFAFNFGTFVTDDSPYELTWTLQSQNVALATFTMIPQLNLQIGSLSTRYEGTSSTENKYSLNVGSVPINWKSTSVGNYTATLMDNPPIYFPSLNGSSNFIRVSFTQQGSGTLLATTMPTFNLILNFKKL